MGDGLFAPWHIILLLLVLVLLFGSRRLPGAAKSLGESLHIFKRSVSGLSSDDDAASGTGGFSAMPTTLPPAQELPSQPAPDPTQEQIQQLQRQVDELQRQQASSGNAGQPNQPF